MNYIKLPIETDLCSFALEEAAMLLPPARQYTLYIAPRLWTVGCSILRTIAVLTKENPFAPYVNLLIDESLARYEWYITDNNGHSAGSKGVE